MTSLDHGELGKMVRVFLDEMGNGRTVQWSARKDAACLRPIPILDPAGFHWSRNDGIHHSRYFRRMQTKLLLTIYASLLMSITSTIGQTTWQSTYGGYSIDEANSVLVNGDGNYLVVGSTGSFGAGNGDIYVLLLDPTGTKIWSRTLGGAGVDQGEKVVQTDDGGYVIAGFTNSTGNGGYDGYVAKIDSVGDLVWEHTYGGADWDFLYSISQSSDEGFIAAGQTYSNGNGGGDAWVIKLDINGDLQWERTFGDVGEDFAHSIIESAEGGYMLAGGHTAANAQNAWLVKLDSVGDEIWNVQVGGDSLDYANAVIQTVDGGYVAVGMTRSYSSFPEALLFKYDDAGGLQWLQHLLQGSGEEYFDLVELASGNIVSVGSVDGLGSGGMDMYFLFTDADGTFISGITNGGDQGTENEVATGIAVAPDGGYVICGYTESFGFGIRDVYVVKTDSLGLTETTEVHSYFDPLTIGELVNSHHLRIWPTLITNGEVLHILGNYPGAAATARITDMRGATLANVSITSGRETSFPVPDLAPGPYMITVLQVGQSPITAKFIIMN